MFSNGHFDSVRTLILHGLKIVAAPNFHHQFSLLYKEKKCRIC